VTSALLEGGTPLPPAPVSSTVGPDRAPNRTPDSAPAGGPADRIIDAALRCLARWGLNKTTVDDVAREAGCGRATLYRLFPGGRDSLLAAVLAREVERFHAAVSAAVAPQTSLEDVIVAMVSTAGATLQHHRALQFLLAHEPESILPDLAFHRMDSLLRDVAAHYAPLLVPWLSPAGGDAGEESARAAEWLARIVIGYVMAPSPQIVFDNPATVRRVVRLFVLPGLDPSLQRNGSSCHVC
jgi:AcrR family transcriptional regulator